MRQQNDPSDLTEEAWMALAPLLQTMKSKDSEDRHPIRGMREAINIILYLLHSGCQWHMLPQGYSPWSSQWTYLRLWRNDGLWERVYGRLRRAVLMSQDGELILERANQRQPAAKKGPQERQRLMRVVKVARKTGL
jgi:transposase